MEQTGNKIVDVVGQMRITGNVIPQSWYKTIIKDTGKPYLAAIVILADIVYWYRPVEIRSEETGQVIAYKNRFKSDLLQRSYSQLSEQFGISKRDATNAVVALEKMGVIKRHFRKLDVGGMVLNNVLFIELIPRMLQQITFGVEQTDLFCDTYHSNKGQGSLKFETGPTQKSDTNTEITTKTTTETIKENIYMAESNEHEVKKSRRKEFAPPTFEQCKEWYDKKGYTFDLRHFFDYFNDEDWIDSKGNRVKDWKRRMVTFQHNKERYDSMPQKQQSVAIIQHTEAEQAIDWGESL